MQLISKIASRFIIVVTIVAFAISTTGFTFYKHNCKHHEVQNSILPVDECCDEIVEESPEEVQSCCSSINVEESKSKCGDEFQEGDCCVTDMSYVRLSESYVSSSNEFSYVDCTYFPVIVHDENDANIDESVFETKEEPDVQKLRPPLYRLYSRVKIDPPLI